jgi:hypothetical protein
MKKMPGVQKGAFPFCVALENGGGVRMVEINSERTHI